MDFPAGALSGQASRATRTRYLVLLWLCSAAVIAYVHRSCLAVPAQTIQGELGLSDFQMSWVLSGFFISYAVFQLPTGWLGDRWGTRVALPVFAAVWSAATGYMGLAVGFLSLLAGCLVNGMGQAGIFPASVNSIAKWFPPAQRALPSGLLGSSMSLGAVFASTLTAYFLGLVGWRTLFVFFSLPGLAWAVGFYLWFRDRPGEHAAVNAAELELIEGPRDETTSASNAKPRPAVPWGALLTSVPMLLICGQQFFRAAGYVFYQSWYPTFLQKARGVSQSESGYLTSLTVAGFALGAMLGGAVADQLLARTGSRRLARQGVAVAGMFGCAVCIGIAFFISNALLAVLVISLGSFCSGLGGPAAYTLTMDLGGAHVATVFSLMNMAGNIGGALCPHLVAGLVALTGQNWNLVLLLFVAVYLAAAVCWLFLDPNRSLFAPEAVADASC